MKAFCSTIQKKIEQLCRNMDNSILVSLLLLRQLSQDDSLFLSLINNNAKQTRYHLWEIVLTNQEGNYLSSLTRALSLVEPSFPFVHKLIVQNEEQTVEESVLKQLINLLSDVSINDLSCAEIYEISCRRRFLGII